MLEFGRELSQMSQRLEKENGANETNRKMLEVRNLKMTMNYTLNMGSGHTCNMHGTADELIHLIMLII